VLLITKKLVHLSFVEAPFLRWLILKQSPWLVFPSIHQLMNEILPRLVEKPTLKGSYSKPLNLMIPKCLVSIYGCQEESGYISHYAFSPSWSLMGIYHVKIGFFETTWTSRITVVLQLNDVLAKHGLNVQVLAYVKDEGRNFSTMIIIATLVVSCEVFEY